MIVEDLGENFDDGDADSRRAVIVGRSYARNGAMEAVAFLASQGVPAQTGGRGLATQIWVGEDVTIPLHCVEVPASHAEHAITLLSEAEDLDIIVINGEPADFGEDDDFDDGDEVDEREDDDERAEGEGSVVISESSRLVNRAMRAAGVSWLTAVAGIFAYTNLLAAKRIGIEPADESRATWAAIIAFIPTVLLVVLLSWFVVALAMIIVGPLFG